MSRVLSGILLFCQRLHLSNVLFPVFRLKCVVVFQCIAHLYCHTIKLVTKTSSKVFIKYY